MIKKPKPSLIDKMKKKAYEEITLPINNNITLYKTFLYQRTLFKLPFYYWDFIFAMVCFMLLLFSHQNLFWSLFFLILTIYCLWGMSVDYKMALRLKNKNKQLKVKENDNKYW